MFWIALELSIPKIGINIMLSLTVIKVNVFEFDGVAESDNTGDGTRRQDQQPSKKAIKKKPSKSIRRKLGNN